MSTAIVDVHTSDELIDVVIDQTLVEQAVRATLAHQQKNDIVEVTVYVTTALEIHQYNREYRKLDSETDVLSFADDDGDVRFVLPPGMPRYLGDIAISWPHVQRQATEYGHSEARELAFLTVHGMLHLLGFDHERSPEEDALMRQHQDEIMVILQLPRA
ncbi:MAG: rRNA maturation RNase YbeY [Chloroflexales bacterium]|nr:rRNA maturation RNase YbeY [Chloroflexales bacterium]